MLKASLPFRSLEEEACHSGADVSSHELAAGAVGVMHVWLMKSVAEASGAV